MYSENITQLIHLLERVLSSRSKRLTKQDEYTFFSPFVNHYKPKLQINIKTGKWHCWVSNTGGHNLFQLFKKIGATKKDFDELSDTGYSIKYRSKSTTITDEVKVELPKEFIPLYRINNTPEYRHAMLYLNKRNITPRDIIKYNIGYCDSGLYKDRIIVPSYDSDGNLNYFVGRSFYDTTMKYKNPPVSKDVIGFDLLINWNEPIILCEGVFDAIAIKRNAVPLFGKAIPKSLYKKIIEKNVNTIYICLDNDAIEDSVNISKRLMDNGIDVKFIKLDDGEDPSSIGFEKFLNEINNVESMTFKDVMKYKLGF
tara:strand:+ start:67 stop:1002 length:936 start_codon:yes stop_codon:yes gene_type:complete